MAKMSEVNEFATSLMEKSLAFAVRIAKLAQFLGEEKKEFVLSRQIARSGTSIGANVRESQFAQSAADFISKISVALKEGSETQYWLEVLLMSEYINEVQYRSLRNEVDRFVWNACQNCEVEETCPWTCDFQTFHPITF